MASYVTICLVRLVSWKKYLNELFKQVKRQQFLWREITWLGIYYLKKSIFKNDLMGIPVTQLHCAPCGLARGQSLDQTRKCKMGPKTFQKYIQIFAANMQ